MTRTTVWQLSRSVMVVLLILVRPLDGLAQTTTPPAECSLQQQNRFVRDVMSDVYLWRQHVPALDIARLDSPESVLAATRYRSLDSTFSYITSQTASDALFARSEYTGVGLSSIWRGDRLFISQVFPGSAASDAGLQRGDEIVEVGGRTIPELIQSGTIDVFASAPTIDMVALRNGRRLVARLIKRAVTIPPVSNARTLNVDGRRVGYVFFRNFTEPSVNALNTTFVELKRQGVTELVLDLRYNSGGLVTIAQYLGGLIGGTLTNGQIFASYSHNDRHEPRDRILRFRAMDHSLRLNRVFVITTRTSASASEVLINALRPFMPVVVVGERTYGKPVGQYLLRFCDRVIAPVAFALRNADGEGDFFAGLPVTCAAEDDLGHEFGDASEASLREVLTHLRTGACSPTGVNSALTHLQVSPVPRTRGWTSVLGAH